MAQTTYLIVTADDFGYNKERNQGIVECFLKGAIGQTSLLVNAVAADHASRLAMEHHVPVGLHLNLVEGVPVASPDSVKSLLDANGQFMGLVALYKALQTGKVNKTHIEIEIEAQLEQFKTLMGCLPRYVDSHYHSHVFQCIRDVYAESLQKYGIKWTRLPWDKTVAQSPWLRASLTPDWRECFDTVNPSCLASADVFKKHGLRSPTHFIGSCIVGANMTIERLKAALQSCSGDVANTPDVINTCELMTHPGYLTGEVGGCGAGPDEFSQLVDRIHEMEILTSQDMKSFYETNNFELTSMQALHG